MPQNKMYSIRKLIANFEELLRDGFDWIDTAGVYLLLERDAELLRAPVQKGHETVLIDITSENGDAYWTWICPCGALHHKADMTCPRCQWRRPDLTELSTPAPSGG